MKWLLLTVLAACAHAPEAAARSGRGPWLEKPGCYLDDPSVFERCAQAQARLDGGSELQWKPGGCSVEPALQCSGTQRPPELIEEARRNAACACVCPSDVRRCAELP